MTAPLLRPALRVLVAEDEALIRMDLVEMLEEQGYDVVGQCGDGASAVRLATERPEADQRRPSRRGRSPRRARRPEALSRAAR